MNKKINIAIIAILVISSFTASAMAQGTGFNFQGRLNDGTNPANGSYDLQFRLYDAIAGGTQIGAVAARPNTTLINGVFSVTLDFGSAAFNTPNSVFIEIAVKPNGSPNAYTILGPRQQLTVVPFAVRANNATNADNATNAQNSVNATNATTAANSLSLGGVVAGNYLQTNGNGSQLTNANAVTATTATTATNALSLGNVAANGWTRLNVQNTGDVILDGRLQISGNATQLSNSNGLVKAMIYVSATGQIFRCYNGNTGAGTTTGNCGFTIVHTPFSGGYTIDLGFQANNRFFSITARNGLQGQNFLANFDFTANPNEVFVFTSTASATTSSADAEFILTVY